jgi:hypothetical protein
MKSCALEVLHASMIKRLFSSAGSCSDGLPDSPFSTFSYIVPVNRYGS